MFDFLYAREIRLAKSVRCDGTGLFLGSVPLLRRVAASPFQDEGWIARADGAIEADLSAWYGLPIDIGSKLGGLAAVARALDRSDLALAHIAALHLQFPDPPSLEKGADSHQAFQQLAFDLYRSGLLKAFYPYQHPRGADGRFVDNPGASKPAKSPSSGGRQWPTKGANKKIRQWAKETMEELRKRAE